METLAGINSRLMGNAGIALVALAAAQLVVIAGLLVYALRWRAFTRKWKTLFQASDGRSLEDVVYEQLRASMKMEEELKALREQARGLERQLETCIQNVGIIRFDAFEDVGGEQSFALALLDSKGDGAVISTVYGRLEGRVYAKSIKDGASPQKLTEEEIEAISSAKGR